MVTLTNTVHLIIYIYIYIHICIIEKVLWTLMSRCPFSLISWRHNGRWDLGQYRRQVLVIFLVWSNSFQKGWLSDECKCFSAHVLYFQHIWASYQIHKVAGCACAVNAGNVFLATDFKGNHYLAIPACITARASRTCRDACRDRWHAVRGKTFPAFPEHAQPAILRIWQEAHGQYIFKLPSRRPVW